MVPLLQGEFYGIARRIDRQSPTWIQLICWIGRKLGDLNIFCGSYLRLTQFQSQLTNEDTPKSIIMKLYTIAHQIPPRLMSAHAMLTAIKTQLRRYLLKVHDRMISTFNHQEDTPAEWLESLIDLPNHGFDLGDRQTPAPIGMVDIGTSASKDVPQIPLNTEALSA